MPLNLQQAVRKAEWRSRGLDLGDLAASTQRASPDVLASDAEKHQRQNLLGVLHASPREAADAYERIIAGNELQDANYLARGAVAARAVLRIVLKASSGRTIGYGTGFLIGDGVLLTNHHVLESPEAARYAEAEAFYERSILGDDLTPWRFALRPDELFFTSEALDFSIVAVAERDRTGAFSRRALGWLPLLGQTGKVLEGEWLTVVQHPEGKWKQVCVRENKLIKRDDDVLWYSTDTLGGSSGSPVFSNDWLVVALHHSGVPEKRDGKWQTIDGRDYDPSVDREDRIKWVANEGIRVSRIVDALRANTATASHALVGPILDTGVRDIDVRLPVLFAPGEAPPQLVSFEGTSFTAPSSASADPHRPKPLQPREKSMTQHITLKLLVGDDGRVSLLQGGASESALVPLEAAAASKPKKNIIDAPVSPATDWVKGYDPDFLGTGALSVPLPIITDKKLIAPLQDAYGQVFNAAQKAGGVLTYNGYSVVVNKERRLAFYSAANVSWEMRPGIGGRSDNWLYDERLDRAHQLDNSYYRNNRFDRGHLTRREDMEWGKGAVEAIRRANGTCTWPNCSPQHEIFNQGKDPAVQLWQQLERYVLEERAKTGQFSVQVITGPVFGGADPEYRGLPYPLEFWKVVVAVAEGGKLFATAYLLSQADVIDKHGLEAAPAEPFGAFATYQRPIAFIENLTGLKFTDGVGNSLSAFDPLARGVGRTVSGRRRTARAAESFGIGGADDALTSLDDVVLF
ncbi:DNA/RNA non-specific endonuclease [Caulobacter hibisci]|uniref:Serine protease n=1 Tax=Caulobacter hibisci TaxID=2035993 RepID=A0ABS0T1U0_9CAUL|nr:DNA/RNA non-specific endonuclease [Caulobacter hibisci]MBI1685080.1 DNA/RNA non-specific endonuclease [Caulobacter hibisci]